MSHAAPAASGPQKSFMERNHFLLRRLHSLSGIVPIGLFVCFHLFTNAQMMLGTFQHEVDWIHSQPALELMEIGLIWLPLAFHAGLGIFYAVNGAKYSVARNGGWSHRRYVLQRVTGIIALVFVLFHVATLRWRLGFFGLSTPFFTHAVDIQNGRVIEFAHQATTLALKNHPLVIVLYLVGALATSYHLANGLWTAAISWGLTLSVGAQKRFGAICVGLFAALTAFSVMGLAGALKRDITPAEEAAYQTTTDMYRYSDRKFIPEKEDMVHARFKINQTDASGRVLRFEFEGKTYDIPASNR